MREAGSMQEVTPAKIGYSEILLQNRFGLQRAADPLRLLLVFEQRASAHIISYSCRDSFSYLKFRAPRTQPMRRFRSVVISIILAVATSPVFSDSPGRGIRNVFWQPNELQQGSVVFITVELEWVPLRMTGKWFGKDLAFFKSDNPKIWFALAGADLDTRPGTYDLTNLCLRLALG